MIVPFHVLHVFGIFFQFYTDIDKMFAALGRGDTSNVDDGSNQQELSDSSDEEEQDEARA